MSVVATAAVVFVAAHGCDVDRRQRDWPDDDGLHKDPYAEVVSDAKQALIVEVVARQRRADALKQRAEAQPDDGALLRDLAELKARLDGLQDRIVSLAPSGSDGVMGQRPRSKISSRASTTGSIALNGRT